MHFLSIRLYFFLFTILLLCGCSKHPQLLLNPHEEMEIVPAGLERGDVDLNGPSVYCIQPGDTLELYFHTTPLGKRDTSQKEQPGKAEGREFLIVAGYTMSVKFVHAPELNETQRVRPDGKISLPYIGEYSVIRKSVGFVEAELRRLYSSELLDPELYVTIPEFRDSIDNMNRWSHELTVRSDGFVTFPMLGDVAVGEEAIDTIKHQLNKKYQTILPGIEVDLVLSRSAGSMIYVLGEVDKSGPYTIYKPVSLLQALSMAGGYLPGAQLNSVIVIRRNENRLTAIKLNANGWQDRDGKYKMFFLQPDDTLLVPGSPLKEAAEIAEYIQSILLFRGWGISLDKVDILGK